MGIVYEMTAPASIDSTTGKPLGAVIYAGHMPDGESRKYRPRFPAVAEAYVTIAAAKAMRRFAQAGAQTAYGSLAAGADIILAEAALDAGLHVVVVIPGILPAFLEASVRPSDDENQTWEERFSRLTVHPYVRIRFVAAEDELTPQSFAEINLAIQRLALGQDPMLPTPARRPEQVQALLVLAHEDGPPALGGTAHFAQQLLKNQIAVEIIDPTDMDSAPSSKPESTTQPQPAALPGAPDLKALLPEFNRLDSEAIVSQRGWRTSLHRMLLLFAILMLVTGLEHMSDETLWGMGRTLRIVAITATILGLGFEAGLGLKPNRSHRSWVRARSQAEALRAAAWSRLMDFPPPALDESVEAHMKAPSLDAMAVQLAAIPPKARWHWYATHRLRDQASYYESRSHRLHKLERRLFIARYVLIIGALLYGILRVVSEFDTTHTIDPHVFHHYNLLGVAIALISLSHVWLESTQAERLAGRYKALARTLSAMANKIEATDSEEVARHIAHEGEELLFGQNEEWIGVVG